MSTPHLALALEGAGWHPAAWREPDAEPHRLFDPARWVDVVREVDGVADLVTIEDSLALQNDTYGPDDGRTDRVRGRLDAVLLAARIGPLTRSVGIVPTATTTHTEPFHVSKAIATLDYVTTGRAGWQVKVSGRAEEAAHFGRRSFPPLRPDALDDPEVQRTMRELFDEAADAVEVVRRLWDSWEDDAIVRDAATGRFIDRDRLHYVDFEGPRFSVRGPSITPRPPQGQPVVAALGHARVPYRLAARSADLLFVTPHDDADLTRILAEVRAEESAAGRTGPPLRVLADLVVLLDGAPGAAAARRERLDARAGTPWASDARIVAGTPAEIADLLQHWASLGADGFRLRPAAIPHDVRAIARELFPALRRRGLTGEPRDGGTLRDRLGLARPASRYTAA